MHWRTVKDICYIFFSPQKVMGNLPCLRKINGVIPILWSVCNWPTGLLDMFSQKENLRPIETEIRSVDMWCNGKTFLGTMLHLANVRCVVFFFTLFIIYWGFTHLPVLWVEVLSPHTSNPGAKSAVLNVIRHIELLLESTRQRAAWKKTTITATLMHHWSKHAPLHRCNIHIHLRCFHLLVLPFMPISLS